MSDAINRAFLESWGDIVDRSEPFFDDISVSYQRQQYATRRRDRNDGRFLPVYDNEVDLQVIRAMARLLHERVPMAKAKTRRLVDYTISQGFDWEVTHGSPEIEARCRAIIKDFVAVNRWTIEGERDSFAQECIDGEFLADLSVEDGVIVLNMLTSDNLVEPMDIRNLEDWLGANDPGLPMSWSFGIHSPERAPHRPHGYHVVRNDAGTDWDYVPKRRMVHWSRNSPLLAKRGYSDSYTTHVYLGRADKVISNVAEGAAIQAAIAYIVEHVEGTSATQASNVVRNLLNTTVRDPVSGIPKRSKKIVPGQRLDIPAGMKYHAGLFGSSNNDIYIGVMESLVRLTGTVEAFPEHMLTGFAGNNNLACHDETTEVLTESGWKLFKDVTYRDALGTFNLATEKLEYQLPYAIHATMYSGEMMHFKSRDVDMLVTPNHRMIVSDHATARVGSLASGTRKTKRLSKLKPWELHRADSLPRITSAMPFSVKPTRSSNVPKQFVLPRLLRSEVHANQFNAGSRRDRKLDIIPWLKFLGWYISEGWVTTNQGKSYGTYLSQNDNEDATRIREVLSRLPFNAREYVAHKKGHITSVGTFSEDNLNWSIMDKGLASWLTENCGKSSHRKRIPDFVWGLPVGLKEHLLDALVRGDGRHLPYGALQYFSVSKELMDGVQRLAFECGYVAQMRKTRNGGVMELSIRKASKRIAGHKRKRVLKLDASRVRRVGYEGFVYCASVLNGTLITRRNGVIGISGNSSLTAESPFVQGRLADQAVRKMRLADLFEKVLRLAVEIGVFKGYRWQDIKEGLEVTVTQPSIVNRDPVALTQALSAQKAEGWISDRTACQELGRDYELEQSQREEEGQSQPGAGPPGAAGPPVETGESDEGPVGVGGMASLSRMQFKRNRAAIMDILQDFEDGTATETQALALLRSLGLTQQEALGVMDIADQGVPVPVGESQGGLQTAMRLNRYF